MRIIRNGPERMLVEHGILVVAANGRIRYIGLESRSCLQRYFGSFRTCLPVPVSEWLKTATLGTILVADVRCSQLSIRLLEPKCRAGCCLVLRELEVVKRPRAEKEVSLTDRERQVLEWVAEGKSNWIVGQILGVSTATIRKHLQNIFLKLGVENRTSAARYLEGQGMDH